MDIPFHAAVALTSLMTFFAVKLGIERIGPAWDVISRKRVQELTQRAEAISLDLTALNDYLRVWGICMIAIPAFVWVFLGLPIIACGSAYLVYIAPAMILDHKIARRRTQLRDQMVNATQLLANTSRAGLNLSDGMREVLKETRAPLHGELERIVTGSASGQSLSDALNVARNRLQLEPFTLFATAAQVTLERGGRLDEAMNRISASLVDAQRIERKLSADTASSKRASIILSMFPFGLIAVFSVLDYDTTSLLFTEPLGELVLLVVCALVFVGCKVALKILDIKM